MELSRPRKIFFMVVVVTLSIMSWFHFKYKRLSLNGYNILLRDPILLMPSSEEDLWHLKNLPESKETFEKILRIESNIFFSRRMYPCPSHALTVGMPLIPKWFHLKMEQFKSVEKTLFKAHEKAQQSRSFDLSDVDWNQEHLLPENDIKIGYYIISHSIKDLWRVKKLIYAIFDPEHTIIVVHCDLRIHGSTEVSEFRHWLTANELLYPYVWLIATEQSLIGRYASISVIYAELLCLHTLLTSPLGYTIDSFIGMTPGDFPIKSKQAILNRLFVYRKYSIYNTGRLCPGSFCFRIENYYCHDFGVGYRRGEPVSIAYDNLLLVNSTGSFFSTNKMTDTEKYVARIGAAWSILSFESVFYLFNTANRRLLYYWLIHYHSSSAPEELFFQTLYYLATRLPKISEHLRYYHNALNYTLLNGSLHLWDALGYQNDFENQWRYMRWRGEMSPSLLEQDIPQMKKSSALFARKFDDMHLFEQWTIDTGLYSDLRPYDQS